MKIKDLGILESLNLSSRMSDREIQGAGRPYANVAADGVAKAGARAKAGVLGYVAYYQVSSASAAAAAGAATVNGLASVFVQVSISY
jgi:hypothetical protein